MMGQFQIATNKNFSMGGYGRIGVNWSFTSGGLVGRQLNLLGMGSMGGRTEEQDYLEWVNTIHFYPKNRKAGDTTFVDFQLRIAVFSQSAQLFGNQNTVSPGGLVFALPEMFVYARGINGTNWDAWIGNRFYRGDDVYLADYFYFDDHSAQGAGVRYRNTTFAAQFIGSADTTTNLPPYFYLNIINGAPIVENRQRVVFVGEQEWPINDRHYLKFLAEYHVIPSGENQFNTLLDTLNFPSDYGFVAGVKHKWNLPTGLPGSFNHFAARIGTRIANGGDGGSTRTWLTYGAPDEDSDRYDGAYSFSVTNHLLLNWREDLTFNGYFIYRHSRGGADTLGTAESLLGTEVFNRKDDLAIGLRGTLKITPYFHFHNEIHFSLRKDGTQDPASMIKVAFQPTLVPTGNNDYWARPELRLVASLAVYNDFALNNQYSAYLQQAGAQRFGGFLGFRAEWWLWD
ncbi:carbohydrate porin [Pontibacter sp. G13]|uniref:carbohydrate porin n=1 Tax=Pontibacter sp. G13 TaxID=3074898 RepID=UPI00288B8802|nr:carbohydrate porin [Pontibacter sp. G13]WNJ19527.1 carbohydrate porin [Pontibacter sp. G13]